jgi:hypothetical protein
VSDRGRVFSRIGLGRIKDCGGCHDQRPCDDCHGLRMPHTTPFVKWQHARDAAFGRKQVCWRCHTMGTCAGCHTAPFEGHGPDWRLRHRGNARNAICPCHWEGLPAEGKARGSYCAVCH